MSDLLLMANSPLRYLLSIPGTVAIYDPGRQIATGTTGQVLTDFSGKGAHIQNGSTAGVDANDGTWTTAGFLCEVSQFALSPTLTDMTLQGDWTVGMTVKSHGTIPETAAKDSRKTLFSLALPGAEDGYVSVEVLAPATESVSDDWYSVRLFVKNGATETVSASRLMLDKGLVRTLLLEASGNVLTLTCHETGESITVTAARAEGNPRLGLGCLATATMGQPTGAAEFYQVIVNSRDLADAEDARVKKAVTTIWRTRDTLQDIDQRRREFEWSLTQRVLELDTAGFASEVERNQWTSLMEEMSGGKNTVKWVSDGAGKYFPSVMVRVPKMSVKDVLGTGTNTAPHPAFIVGENVLDEIHVGKYQAASIYSNSKHIGVSLYGVDVMGGGWSYTSLVGAQAMGGHPTYDTALQYCANGGTGFHLVTNAEWAAIALLCKNLLMFQPKGNNYYGRDFGDPATPEYYGVPAYMYDSKVARVGAGTGLISWAHDGTPWGVFDLNGNVTEWVAGLRQVAGEVQVIEDNDAANYLFGDSDKDQGRESALWKAFDAAGSLVTPECTIASDGTVTDTEAGATLKLQPGGVSGAQAVRLDLAVTNRTTDSVYCPFGDIAVDGVNVTSLPEVMVSLGLAPPAGGQSAAHGADRFYMRNDASGGYAETLVRRGGNWDSTARAGVFYLTLASYRSIYNHSYGARPAFVEVS